MVAAFRFTAVLLGATAAFVSAADEYFEGDGTSYTLGQVSSGNCNFMSAIPTASTNYVALNQAQWDTLGNCGRCIEVSCVDEQCTVQNKTAVVQVLDRCPECAHGALDLSPTVYKEITGLDPNRLTVRWRFVDCPDPGNVQVCLKEGSNANWIAVQPTNGLVGVESVTVNGAKTTMLDGAYYYVSTASGADLSAVKVAITSINGDVISGSYSLTAGKCTDTKKQFGSGSSSQSTSQTSAPATTTAAPKATTATPTATTATPSTTAPTQTYSSSASEEGSNSDESQTGQIDQSSQSDATQNDASSSSVTTPEATTATPEATTATPEATTATPEATTATPEATTATPEATTATPEATTAPTDTPTQSGDTSKCRVRSSRRS